MPAIAPNESVAGAWPYDGQLFFALRSGSSYGLWHGTKAGDGGFVRVPLDVPPYPSNQQPSLSVDGLSLYYTAGNVSGARVHVSRRQNTSSLTFATGVPMIVADAGLSFEWTPTVHGDTLYFGATASGRTHLYRAALGDAGPPTPISELDSPADEIYPRLTADGLRIYYSSTQNGVGVAPGYSHV